MKCFNKDCKRDALYTALLIDPDSKIEQGKFWCGGCNTGNTFFELFAACSPRWFLFKLEDPIPWNTRNKSKE